jgi:hypothetical protein
MNMNSQSKRARRIFPSIAWWLAMAGQVAAAPSASDLDLNAYFNHYSYTGWESWLLIGAISLLVVAIVMKVYEARKPQRRSDLTPTPADRIGTMPIDAPEAVTVHRGDERMTIDSLLGIQH